MFIITGERRREPFPWGTVIFVIVGLLFALAKCQPSNEPDKPMQTPWSTPHTYNHKI